ncbi:MAG: thiamine diphosphokinase [Gemmobacter sp.]
MSSAIVQSPRGVTLVGGGPVSDRLLSQALRHAPDVVAADAGADRLLQRGLMPRAVIGDFDSITPSARAALSDRLHHIPEQDSTDFDKALRSIDAPFVLGLGFTGARVDHGLAVLNALARHAQRRCLILGDRDVTFVAPPELELSLPVGTRLSLFPLGPVAGESEGLRWPIAGLRFAPDGMIGTSNEVAASRVRLRFDARRMLVILPRGRLEAALAGLGVAPLTQPKASRRRVSSSAR